PHAHSRPRCQVGLGQRGSQTMPPQEGAERRRDRANGWHAWPREVQRIGRRRDAIPRRSLMMWIEHRHLLSVADTYRVKDTNAIPDTMIMTDTTRMPGTISCQTPYSS